MMAKKKNAITDPVETADSIPAEKAAEIVEAPVKKTTRRTSKKAAADTVVDTAVKAAETPAENTVPTETPVKKPRSKKAKAAAEETTADTKTSNASAPSASDTTVAPAVAKEPKKASKTKEPTLTIKTILQVGDKEFDITNIAEAALKEYKSVHKRKNVTDFVIYVKPEDNAAYYTVNGEGAEDYKVEL